METFLSGYCRSMDSARTVMVDTDENCADCTYPNCPHQAACPLAEEITRLLEAK